MGGAQKLPNASELAVEAFEKPSDFLLAWLVAKGTWAKNVLRDSWKAISLSLTSPGPLAHSRLTNSGVEGAFSEDRLLFMARLSVSLISAAGAMVLTYYMFRRLDPQFRSRQEARKKSMEILRALGVSPIPRLTDYEVCIAVSLVDTSALETSWNNIGGLEETITDLCDSVILPFKAAHALMPRSKLFRAPKGVLLYGPPGCGKTLLARAMAKAASARFFNLQISNLVNMYYGESQKLAEAVFSLAHKLQPSIIFIDEIDSFLSTRSVHDNEATRMMKTQFMALWDGLLSENNSRILIIGATNRPGDLDSAILRRLPYKARVPLPDASQRLQILRIHLKGEPLDDSVSDEYLQEFANRAEGLSGSDLFEICREAALRGLKGWLNSTRPSNGDGILRLNIPNPSISMDDFEHAFKKFRVHRPEDPLTQFSSIPHVDGLD
ncbi:hypothetical protein Aperf_G00000004438 [Anoplocephala perfoliata]